MIDANEQHGTHTAFDPERLAHVLSSEDDLVVQSSILNVFESLRGSKIGQSVLNDSFASAANLNRALTTELREKARTRAQAAEKEHIARALGIPAEQIPTPIPERLASKLTFEDFITGLSALRGFRGSLDDKDGTKLDALASVLNAFIDAGARIDNLSGVFCEGCDFSLAKDLPNTRFDDAPLRLRRFRRSISQCFKTGP
jgi:hypothetical protein